MQVKTVKRKTGPFLQKSHQKQANNKQGTARHGNQEPPGQAPRYTGQEANNTTPRDFEHRSRYVLTYIEVFRSMFKSNNVQRLIPHCMWRFTNEPIKLQLTTEEQRDELRNLSETAYTHYHSIRCGHLGPWPSPSSINICIVIEAEWKLVLEQEGPWLRRGIPDLAYGTSARYSRFSLRDIGRKFIVQVVDHWMLGFQWSKRTALGAGQRLQIHQAHSFLVHCRLDLQAQLWWSWAQNGDPVYAAMLLCPLISIDEMDAGTSSHRPQANISECQRGTALAASRKEIE